MTPNEDQSRGRVICSLEGQNKDTMYALPDMLYLALFNRGPPGVGYEIAPALLWGADGRPAIIPIHDFSIMPRQETALTVAIDSQIVTHAAYYDAAHSGNMLIFCKFERELIAGDLVTIAK